MSCNCAAQIVFKDCKNRLNEMIFRYQDKSGVLSARSVWQLTKLKKNRKISGNKHFILFLSSKKTKPSYFKYIQKLDFMLNHKNEQILVSCWWNNSHYKVMYTTTRSTGTPTKVRFSTFWSNAFLKPRRLWNIFILFVVVNTAVNNSHLSLFRCYHSTRKEWRSVVR